MGQIIRVVVLGACGKMGREVVKAVTDAPDMQVVGACDVACAGSTVSEATGVAGLDMKIESDLAAMLDSTKPGVLVDFAKPFLMDNARLAMSRGVVPIIGSTGQTPEQLAELEDLSRSTGTGVMVIPNFAVGAILMMKFAAEAAKYMPEVEIIELHHDRKADAPSGTSIKTAEMIDAARRAAQVEATMPSGSPDDPARGERRNGVHVHSVRLPGLVAHQEVIFGGQGQTLTIRHDSTDRMSFMPGVMLAVRRATTIQGLVYGLDKLL